MLLIKDLGLSYPSESSKKRKRFGVYECPLCGDHVRVLTTRVKTGRSSKCHPCSKKQFVDRGTTHGMTGTRLHGIYVNMRSRCYHTGCHNYNLYGGRGIKICNEWQDPQSFFDWAEVNGYEPDRSIDRIDNDKGYCPENCRFVDLKAQAQNRRKREGCKGSKYIGVRRRGSFQYYIMIDGKSIEKTGFKTEEEAAIARDRFILDSGNKYAKLNILKRTQP